MAASQKDYYSEWYSKNKDKHLEYLKQKIPCEVCNKLIIRNQLSVHKKTKNHILNYERFNKINELVNKISETNN
jgi:hypothetical protein